VNAVTRGMRNAFRNSIRTFSIIVILGLSIGLTLAMLVARAAVQDKITSVKSSIGNTITVSPAGSQGFEGGGEPLTNEQIAKLSELDNVTKVSSKLDDRLTSENSDLESAIEPGSLGKRRAGNSGVGFEEKPQMIIRGESSDGSSNITRTFTPPVNIIGTDDPSNHIVYGGGSVSFTSGQAFDGASTENVAVVGKTLAEKNSLQAGSTFKAYDKDIKVVGIYDAGNDFANNGVIMPLAALQELSGQAGSITSTMVAINSIDNADSVTSAVKSTLGDSADVVNNKETAESAVEPLESVKTIATFSLIGSIVAGSVVILLTMVMIVRERRREIGVFKAIGASNVKIMLQFMSEAVTLTVLGMVAGVIIGAAGASPLTNTLVSNSSSATKQTMLPAGDGVSKGPGPGGGIRSFGNNATASIQDVQASVGWDILGYGVITALTIAVIGSAIPAFFISKIRPAEVMRAE